MSSGITRRAHPKSKFDKSEDEKLKRLVNKFGQDDWNLIANKMKGRSVRQCRERWLNYLDPNLNKGVWTEEEDKLLYEKFNEIGRRWKVIASFFENRTDINVKNRWLMLERHRLKNSKKNEMKETPKESEKESSDSKTDEEEEESTPAASEPETSFDAEVPVLPEDSIFNNEIPNTSHNYFDSIFDFPEISLDGICDSFEDWSSF